MDDRVSIVIPALNERVVLPPTLAELQPARREGHEVILVDGGSDDGTPEVAGGYVDLLVVEDRGRARQMNAGARQAGGDTLLFLHADTLLPWDSLQGMLREFPASGRCWGRFDVRLSGRRRAFRMIETMINLRVRWSAIATGDQAIFVRRGVFEEVGGYPEIAVMEDIALTRRLKRRSRPLCLRQRVTTSSRRWEERGVTRTILLMWWLRLAFVLGADPDHLAASYRESESGSDREV
jgi:rSAM/selenodomain-associated transferase 2